MHLERYEIKAGSKLEVYEFTSIGPKGSIKKLVKYTLTNYKNIYNLGFGDKDVKTDEMDDLSISNNMDSAKVLSTVAATLYVFFNKRPNAMVYATGSTKARTRLYQMGINKYLEEGNSDFLIYGQINNSWQIFEKGLNYDAFLVKLKE